MIVVGALIAGLAVGMRTQTIWLTLPLLAWCCSIARDAAPPARCSAAR